jgi:hypothetical protein
MCSTAIVQGKAEGADTFENVVILIGLIFSLPARPALVKTQKPI